MVLYIALVIPNELELLHRVPSSCWWNLLIITPSTNLFLSFNLIMPFNLFSALNLLWHWSEYETLDPSTYRPRLKLGAFGQNSSFALSVLKVVAERTGRTDSPERYRRKEEQAASNVTKDGRTDNPKCYGRKEGQTALNVMERWKDRQPLTLRKEGRTGGPERYGRMEGQTALNLMKEGRTDSLKR